MSKAIKHPVVRRFKLSVDELKTLDDVKKILDLLDIRLQTDNPVWEEVGQFFTTEVIPKGYFKLRERIGEDEIVKLSYCEMEQQALELLNEDEK